MRRIIISTMYMAAAIVLAASCNKIEDKPVSAEGNGKTVINGVAEAIGGGTKAYNRYSYEVLWNEGDQIWVTDGTKDGTFTLTDGEDTPKGVFTEDGKKGITGNIEAFYPASLKTDDGYVWPATQTNNQVAPMFAKQSITGADGEVVSFSSLGAMLQIVFNSTTPDITVTSITLKDSKKPLSGLFTVTDGQAMMTESSANPGITLDLGTGVAMGNSAKYFYISIPAGKYNDDKFTLTFTDTVHHKECVMTSTTFPDVERNTVGRITLAGNFQNQKFNVKLDMNNTGLTGSFTTGPDDLTNVEANKTITEPGMPYAENYAIRGWCKDAECTSAWDFANETVTGNITLYAKWVSDPLDGEGKAKINGHDYVKLAGYYWGTENAIDIKTEAGYLYRKMHSAKYGDYFTQCSKINSKSYSTSGNARRVVEHFWEDPWNLPSEAQWQALIDKCDWTWTDDYDGKEGYLITGREVNFESGHMIFLPAAGYSEVDISSNTSAGDAGYYWLSSYKALVFVSRRIKFEDYSNSSINAAGRGYSVRPVSE